MYCGTDIIEIKRIEKALKNKNFLKRVFSKDEIEMFKLKNFNSATIAANFAAKEAVSKALGTGFKGFFFSDILILREVSGKPYVKLSDKVKKRFNNFYFTLSLSHCKDYAVAFVIAYKKK